MTWRRGRPTRPGYYWRRNPGEGVWRLIEVLAGSPSALRFHFDSTAAERRVDRDLAELGPGGHWAGPIEGAGTRGV
jgi:hypothetical protein